MTSRRKFISLSVAAAAAALVPAGKAEAASPKFPSNVVYTEKDPGVWAKKAATHLPQVERNGNKVVIRTLHPMTKDHYIVRHTLVDDKGNVIGAKTFSNTDEKAVSRFELPEGAKGTYYATSFCNKHDFWVKKVKL